MLKELCAAAGVSGGEDEIRELIKSRVSGFKTHVDVMGNLLVETGGRGRRIMFAAHMDEVGLIISGFDDNGFIKFKTVGGIDPTVLPGKKVYIGKSKIPGIIGIRAVHLQEKEEREKVVREKNLYIDIGAVSKDEAEAAVALGDYAVFDFRFMEFGDRLISAKALDDRAGCAVMLSLLEKHKSKNLCCAFTAQEETGTRGAQAAAEYFKPDIAVVIETTICNDVYQVPQHLSVTYLGAGPVISFMDRTSTPDRAVMESIIATAREHKIPWQFKRTTMGGTDAGVISRAAEGIPTAIIAMPCRNLHSPATVISLDDYENTIKLLSLWIDKIGNSENGI